MEFGKENSLKLTLNRNWRRKLYIFCVISAGLMWLVEIGMFYGEINVLRLSQTEHILRFLAIPGIVEIVALSIAFYRMKSKQYSDGSKNMTAATLAFVVIASVQCTYYFVAPFLSLSGLAVVLTVIFTDRRITLRISGLSLLSLGVASLLNALGARKGDTELVFDILASFFILAVCFICALEFVRYEQELLQGMKHSYKRQQELIDEMKVDSLTGLFNRKALTESIEAKIRLYGAMKQPMQMAVMDLDFFKKVNDTYGHAHGDDVLIALAKVIKERVRGKASAFRYGGEEFVVLFQKQKMTEAIAIIEEIRIVFAMQKFNFMKPGQNVTVSCGIAEFEKLNWSAGDWFTKADEMLYLAKNNGRNQTIYYKNGESHTLN